MKVLKGFGLAIFSFLLFLSLFIFGIAFMLNSTLLNPGFVASEVDKIDVSALVRELTEEQIGKQLPEEASFIKEAIYGFISDQEPWLKEQLNAAIYSGYDYFLGKSEKLNIVIPLEPLKVSLRDSLWQTLEQNLPLVLTSLSGDQLKLYIDQHYQELVKQIPKEYLMPVLEDQLKPYFDQYYQELVKQIPNEYTVDESSIPPEVMTQITSVRQYISLFQTIYKALIGFMVLLVLLIILINRNVRGTTRSLGTNFLIYGALEFAGVYVARNYALASLPMQGVPTSLQAWLMGVFGDLLAPLQMFSLGLLIGGVILLVISFAFKPRVAED